MKKYILNISSILLILLFTMGCHKDLDTVYDNLPDEETVNSTPSSVYSLSQSTFYNWYMTVTSSISPRMAMWVMADQGTCSWANSGMYHLSAEPRKGFNNTTSYTYASIFEAYYRDLYGTLFMTNNTLKALERGMDIGDDGDDNEKVRAIGYFMQGLSLGYIGLVYDQAFIVDEFTEDCTEEPVTEYQAIIDRAIESLDKCIEVCENNRFDVEERWINGVSYSSDELAQLANSFAARLMVYGSRNAEQNEQVDWSRVLNYANNGIQKDLAPYMDNASWKCWYKYYTVRPGWARIDCRIINMMDSRYPWRFPEDGSNPARAQTEDNRINSDFTFAASNNMKPERGYEHYSNYEHSRSTYAISTHTGNVVDFSVAENELFKAEAYAKLGNLSEAINIINAGSRVTRGGLSPLPANSNEIKVMKSIFYERDLDLIQTGFGIAFFDMRRRDMLQPGTMLHFPIPSVELMVMQMPNYTFGGVANADGENVSNGGWFPGK